MTSRGSDLEVDCSNASAPSLTSMIPGVLRHTSAFCKRQDIDYASLSPNEQRFARMVFYSLWSDGGGFPSYGDGFEALGREAATRSEIAEVVDTHTRRAAFLSTSKGLSQMFR